MKINQEAYTVCEIASVSGGSGNNYVKAYLSEDDPIVKALTAAAESMSKLIFAMSEQLDDMQNEISKIRREVI